MYDPVGQPTWARRVGRSTVDVATGIALATDGSVYATGYFVNSIDLDCTTLTSGNPETTWIARLPSTLVGPPEITCEPQATNVIAGTDVNFGVTAAGAAPLRYQWQFNDLVVPDATNSSLTISNAQPPDAGNYSVVVTNAYGAVTSSV